MTLDILLEEQSRLIFLAARRRSKRRIFLTYGSVFIAVVMIASLPIMAGW